MRKDGYSSLPLYYCVRWSTQMLAGCGVVVGIGGDCLLLKVAINHKGTVATQLWQAGSRFWKMSSAFPAAQTVKRCGLDRASGLAGEHSTISFLWVLSQLWTDNAVR